MPFRICGLDRQRLKPTKMEMGLHKTRSEIVCSSGCSSDFKQPNRCLQRYVRRRAPYRFAVGDTGQNFSSTSEPRAPVLLGSY